MLWYPESCYEMLFKRKRIIVHLFFNHLHNFIEAWVEGGFNPGSESHFCFKCLRVDVVLGEIDWGPVENSHSASTEVAPTIFENKGK